MIHMTELEMKEVLAILKQHFKNGHVLAFGSRFKGTHKKFSDLDLAFVKHDGNHLTISEWGALKEAFEESELSFRVDVIDYWGSSENFRSIIDKSCVKLHEG
ncbi:MAG: nucleotidyltransferase domain-containing protein [Defluviitaleaceae bacterium]|nr:nucleotidyltransferase domain-containing protein [Defluviitaleaceae bacterium]